MLEQTGVIKRSRSATKGNSKRKLKVAANFDLTKVTSQPELHSQSTTHHTAVTPHSHSDPKLCSSPDAINTQCDEPRCDDTNQSKGTEVSSPTGSNVVDVFFKVVKYSRIHVQATHTCKLCMYCVYGLHYT